MFKQPRQKVVLSLLVGGVWGVVFGLMKYHQSPDWMPLDTINQAVSVAMAIVSFGAAWLFWSGLQHFKEELRRAYRLLCLGLVLFGFSQAQFAIFVSLLGWWFWVEGGIITLPYLVSAATIFWALRRFARLMNVSGAQNSFMLATGCALAAALLFAVLPHPPRSDELSNDVIAGLAAWDTVFFAFAAAIVWRIRGVIGQVYDRAMNWLLAGLMTVVIGGAQFAVVQLLLTTGNWYFDGSMTIIPFFIGSLILLRAGYEMAVIGQDAAEADQPVHKAQTKHQELPLIDIIVFLSSLVSAQREIDPLLDKLRTTTVSLGPDKHLTAHDRATLLKLYHELENYLVTRERLREFSRQEIHEVIKHHFGLSKADVAELQPQSDSAES